MAGIELPNPYESPRTRQMPRSGGMAFLICTWALIAATLVTATPLVLFAVAYVHHRLNGPPTFPGDPDIGFGILMLLVMLNAPTALGWLIWLVARFR